MNAPSRTLAVRSALAAGLALALLLPAGAAHAEDDIGADALVAEESIVALDPGEQTQEAAPVAKEIPAVPEPLPVAIEEAPIPQEEAPISESGETEIADAPGEPATDPLSEQRDPATEENAVPQARGVALPEVPGSSIAAAMLPKRTVSGTVTDANGLPVPAEVALVTSAGELTVNADPNGVFSIPDVPIGNYTYQVYYPGLVSAWGTATLTPQSGQQLDIVLSLYSQVSGRVVDINGQGIAGARVTLHQGSDRSQSTSTAADGTYTLQNIEPGQGTVQFTGAQGTVFASAWWSGASAGSEATVLTFPKTGTVLTGIDAQLHAAAVATGYVLMPDDSPVDRAVVIVRDSEGAIVFDGSSDATGRFATTGLPPGDYTVQASKWIDADNIELTSAEQNFTMSGQPYNLQPLVLDREAEPEPIPVFQAADDSYSTPKNTLLQVAAPGVLANDDLGGLEILDPEEAAFAVEGLVTATTHGEVLIAPDGSFVYQPDDDFVGTDTFTYKLWDLSSTIVLSPDTPRLTATVTITIGAENNGGNNGGNNGNGNGNGGSDPNGGTGKNGTGTDTAGTGSSSNTTNDDTSTNTTSDRLAQTGFDGNMTLWVIGIAAFLLLDGAALLIIMSHRKRRASAVLEGLELAPNEGQER